ncbi:MAG: efflux RND transporter periplasmic adaptor subunit [Bdellovibrionales bacterium]|nr:efflux RND transporter periplasmic adaptor subunit [Bdellovibrionales bacterium]
MIHSNCKRVGALALLVLVACSKKSVAPAGGIVTKGDLLQRVTVSGRIMPTRKSIVSAPYAGYVQKLYVKVGDAVKEGDPIVSVRPELRSVDGNIYPLRSPLTGVITQILRLEGEAVEATGSDKGLVRIDDTSRLMIQANVPEIDIIKMREGQEGVIKASAILDRSYKGLIRTLSRSAKQETNRWDSGGVEFPVLIEITDKDEALKPGMSVVVDIIAQKVTGVLMAPLQCIEKEKDGFAVTLDTGEKRKIEIGLQNDESAEIKSGLKEGDRLKQVDFLAISNAG